MVIGIDPSAKSTGLVVWTGKKFIYKCFKLTLNPEKTFCNVYHDANQQSSTVAQYVYNVSDVPGEESYVYGECPPPSGNYSAGLYGLDFLLYYKIARIDQVEGVWNFNPNYLGFVHGTRSYKKSDSVRLFTDCIQTMGFEVPRINADTAEAGLFCLRGMAAQGCPEVECLRHIYPRLFVEKEKNLY